MSSVKDDSMVQVVASFEELKSEIEAARKVSSGCESDIDNHIERKVNGLAHRLDSLLLSKLLYKGLKLDATLIGIFEKRLRLDGDSVLSNSERSGLLRSLKGEINDFEAEKKEFNFELTEFREKLTLLKSIVRELCFCSGVFNMPEKLSSVLTDKAETGEIKKEWKSMLLTTASVTAALGFVYFIARRRKGTKI